MPEAFGNVASHSLVENTGLFGRRFVLKKLIFVSMEGECDSTIYKIGCESQKNLPDWLQALKNRRFKISLINNFLTVILIPWAKQCFDC